MSTGNEIKLEFDTKGFLRSINLADQQVRGALLHAGTLAGMRLMADSVTKTPTVPHDKGTLRGSGSVFVDNKPVFNQPMQPGDSGTPDPATQGDAQLSRDEIVVQVGFNTPYAARLHEHPEYNFSESGAGGKYLETPLYANAEDYIAIFNHEMTKVL